MTAAACFACSLRRPDPSRFAIDFQAHIFTASKLDHPFYACEVPMRRGRQTLTPTQLGHCGGLPASDLKEGVPVAAEEFTH